MSAEKTLNILGWFYILIGSLSFFNVFYYGVLENIFWFCYIGLLLIGIGILNRDSPLIKSQVYILAIPNIIWTIDFIVRISTGTSFLGITDYFFEPAPLMRKIVTLQHLFTLPFSLYSLSKIKKVKDRAWTISVLQVTLLYFATIFLTLEESNVNCAYHFCGLLEISYLYPLWWFAAVFFMIFITRKSLQALKL